MDKEYFDARFDGLEKLMDVYKANTDSHINAVSSNVKRVESALAEHKESTGAHGIEAAGKNSSSIVSWMGLGLATVLGMMEIFKGQSK